MEHNFERAFKFVIDHEGEYVNNPNDPGGETNFGISKRSYPDLDISNITIKQAKEIYHRDYWRKAECEMISDKLDIVIFDTSVNCGVSRALEWLQVTHDWRDYLFLRLKYYTGLNIAKTFMVGWTRRVIDLWKLIREI